MRRAGIGRKTQQRNPAGNGGAENLGQWLNAVTTIKGDPGGNMAVADAVAMIRSTPSDQRSKFAKEIWNKRRSRYGPTGRKDGSSVW